MSTEEVGGHIELRHLRYFLAVAHTSNFTRAAETLGIGQPPLSQQIKALEQELGVQLFNRTSHGAELTPAGKVFEDEARRVIDGATRAVKAAQGAAHGLIGHIRVGFTGTATLNAGVSDLIRRFRGSYPDVEMSVQEATSGVLFKAIETGDLDVAMVRPERRIADSLRVQNWQEESMLVALPIGHHLANQRKIALTDLTEEPFVQVPREAGSALFDDIVSACQAAGFQPHIVQEAPQIASAVTLVAAGLGISIVPAAIAQVKVRGVAYRPLDFKGLIARLVIASRREESSAVVHNFLALARSLQATP